MRTIKIDSYDQFKRKLGSGQEANVYSYKNKYAVKVFSRFQWQYDKCLSLEKLDRKMKKVEAMMSLKDKSAIFPLGFASVPNDDKAYYMPIVLPPKEEYPVQKLSDYEFLYYNEEVEEILIKASDSLERIHTLGVAIGDIREGNILIKDGKEPIFADLDNGAFEDFSFDLVPIRANCLRRIYGGSKKRLIDNDKLVFALMVLEKITRDDRFSFTNGATRIKSGLDSLKVDKETYEVLECILSDAPNKPYIGKVLSKIRKY